MGKIPGGFKKREGRPSDKAILVSRLIDRPLRPLFPKGFFNDVAVVATALSVEPDIQPEAFAMIGSSIALSISDIPFAGPTGSVVVGMVDGKYVINPNAEQREVSRLALNLSGTKDAIMMVEAGSKEISEEEMLNAILFGHEEIKKQCEFIEFIVSKVGKQKIAPQLHVAPEEIDKQIREYADEMVAYSIDTFDRAERQAREEEVKEKVKAYFEEANPDAVAWVGDVLYKMTKEKVRKFQGSAGKIKKNRDYPTPILHHCLILHPILHPKSSASTGYFVLWCRKCRRFFYFFGSASIWVIDIFLHVLAWLINLSDNQHIN